MSPARDNFHNENNNKILINFLLCFESKKKKKKELIGPNLQHPRETDEYSFWAGEHLSSEFVPMSLKKQKKKEE